MCKIRIVVVEDDADILHLLSYNLQSAGFGVRTAEDGYWALSLIRQDFPHLVILDLMIPELDGFEVCKELKRAAETRSIPVIMLTARGEEVDRIVGLELGADDYVVKPFSPRELLLRILGGPSQGDVRNGSPRRYGMRRACEWTPRRIRCKWTAKMSPSRQRNSSS